MIQKLFGFHKNKLHGITGESLMTLIMPLNEKLDGAWIRRSVAIACYYNNQCLYKLLFK